MIVPRYLKSYFFFDFMACVPILIYEASYGFSNDYDVVTKMYNSRWYGFWAFFKIFKLMQYLRIGEVLTRFSQNLDELFPLNKVLIANIRKIMWVAIRFFLATHILSCMFIMTMKERIIET